MALNDTNILSDFPENPAVSSGGNAFEMALYAIISMFVLVGLAYLLSKVLNNRRIEEWAKDEFLQAMISAAIVGGLFLLLAPQTGLIISAFNTLTPEKVTVPVWEPALVPFSSGGPALGEIRADSVLCSNEINGTILCFSYSYLAHLQSTVIALTTDLLIFNIIIELLASLSFNLILVQITPLAGLTSISQVVGSIIQTMIFLGVIIGVEMALINFISSTALTIFLPIGAILRCFFATRRIGGLLMGVAIGMYLVFPLTMALNSVAINQDLQKDFNELETLFSTTSGLDPYTSDSNEDEAEWTSVLTDISSGLGDLKLGLAALPQLWIHLLSSLVVQVVFLPAISMIITVISIKELAALFGSEVSLGRFEV